MSVNVALCGSIPRSSFLTQPDGPCGLQELSRLYGYEGKEGQLPSLHCENTREHSQRSHLRPILSNRQPLGRVCEAPAWAVPAKGDTRLEPVCDGIGRQSSVDLTRKSFYRVGRSPMCDVQLLHGTSSRRHAMLFHHSNGSCYVVDCGSAHGTYVNGVKIASPGGEGLVVPHKVRRGAMIRFGGPGAPCFVLKSFSFRLEDITRCIDDKQEELGELVRRNTRLNALGASVSESIQGYRSSLCLEDIVTRKRSFDSLSTSATLDEEFEPSHKRTRCSSPPLSPESSPFHLVSPDVDKRRVHFSTNPPQAFYPALVTPEESLSAEEDNDDPLA
ncbi:hypothetical protein ACA910_015160 [Epithemia clementina (nom. ined.)]